MTGYVKARGAVSVTPGSVQIVDIEVPEPTGAEFLIQVEACGLCHSDIHFMDGTSGTDHPYILGHEVAGTVRQVGPGVTKFAVGDRVVGSLVVPCGGCEACERGRPRSCASRRLSVTRPRLTDGSELTPVLGLGGLAEFALLDERHATVLPDGIEFELGALLGCGIPTGFGAAVNTGAVRPGDRVAVIGAGGVGLAAIGGARSAGAAEILAVDLSSERLGVAVEFGATQTWAVRQGEEHSDPASFDVVIDCVGGAAPLHTALDLVRFGGRIVIAGAPRQDETTQIPLRRLFDRRVEIVLSYWGDCDPDRDIPRIAALALAGEFPLERYRSETVSLDQAPEAYERLRKGEVVRSLVVP